MRPPSQTMSGWWLSRWQSSRTITSTYAQAEAPSGTFLRNINLVQFHSAHQMVFTWGCHFVFTWPCCRLGLRGVAGTLGVLVTHHPSPRSRLLFWQDLHAVPTQMGLAKLSIPRSPALTQASPQALYSSVSMSKLAESQHLARLYDKVLELPAKPLKPHVFQ